MLYKVYGIPLSSVYGFVGIGARKKRKRLFSFDNNGEYMLDTETFDKKNSIRILIKFKNEQIDYDRDDKEIDEVKVDEELTCTECGFVAKNKSGLLTHSRKHKADDDNAK